MKIVGMDNYNRESIADKLHSEGYKTKEEAQAICDQLNAGDEGNRDGYYYQVVGDDYRLWRGMEDLV